MKKTNPGCFAEVTNDFIFKKTFASEQDKELLIALLNAFQGQTIGNRDCVLDIRCQDEADNLFIVEMQVAKQTYFFKRAIFYVCMSIADSGRKGEDYDFDINFGSNCEAPVQYFSLSNEDHPEIRYDYVNLIFVRLPRFKKSLDECESLQERLLYSICHAHEFEEQPEQLRGGVFDRLFTVIKYF